MRLIKQLTATVAILLLATSLNAQSIGPATLNATGGSNIIGTNEFDWSVGEMTMVSTFTSTGIIVTQGVLQPYDGPTGVANHALPEQQLKVFPNPASTVVNMQYTSPATGTLTYRLMDMAGKIIACQTIDVKQGANSEQVNVMELACAAYLLEVTITADNAAPESTTFKIQKLQ